LEFLKKETMILAVGCPRLSILHLRQLLPSNAAISICFM